MAQPKNFNDNFQTVVEIAIRIGFLALVVFWCLRILYPFTSVIAWGLILAMASAPAHLNLTKRFNGNAKLASAIIVIISLLLIIIPSWLFLDSIVLGARELSEHLESGSLKVPPPNASVADWPLIGGSLFDAWNQAASNLEGFAMKHSDQLKQLLQSVLSGIKTITGAIFMIIIAIIISGILLAANGAEQAGKKFFRRLVGEKGDEFTKMTASTVRSVVKGVIGVAFIQAFLVGIGCFFVGIPYPGLWTLVALIMGILQLPVTLLAVVIIIWLFSSMGTGAAVLWTIYFIVAGVSDNVLKPILLGKGSTVPMVVIFLGVIGGFMTSGFIGLFTGAIIVSLGYKLFMIWLNQEDDTASPQLETTKTDS